MPNHTGRALYGAANTSIFGLNGSVTQAQDGDERTTNFQLHPSIRNNWKSADRLRDVLGSVPVVFDVEGTTYVKQNLITTVQSAFKGTATNAPAGSILYEPTNTYGASLFEPFVAAAVLAGGAESMRIFDLVYDEEAWDDARKAHTPPLYREQMIKLLHQDLEGTSYIGVPYFIRYFGPSPEGIRPGLLTTDTLMKNASEDVEPILPSMVNSTARPWIYDHTFEYYKHHQQVAETVYNIEIDPIYNYFLDSDPDYEAIIAPSEVPESLIPNYYMLEISLARAGDYDGQSHSSFEYLPYLNEISFGGSLALGIAQSNLITVPVQQLLFGITPSATTAVQQLSQGYLQYYAATLEQFNEGTTTLPNAVTTADIAATYNSAYKNVAVLTPEVQSGLLGNYNTIVIDDRGTENNSDDDILAITSYPYYNKISIPYENQFDGPSSQVDFYQVLQDVAGLTSVEAEKFLTLMQLYVCDQHSANASESESFNIYDKTESGDAKPMVQQNMSTDLVFALEEVIQGLNDPSSNTLERCINLANFYDLGRSGWTSQVLAPPDFVPLRDSFIENAYFADPGPLGFLPATLEQVATAIISITRAVEDFYEGVAPGKPNTIAASDPLIYIVEKRAISPGQLSAVASGPPAQTFFIGRDYVNASKKGIVYYDTQIKYGVRYQYDIKQVRMVFGNRYRYGPLTQARTQDLFFGRAFGNAMGIFSDPSFDITRTATHEAIENQTALLPTVANPTVDKPSWGEPDFTYLPDGGELSATPPGQGYHGYYVYRWAPSAAEVQYRNTDAYIDGIFTAGASILAPELDLSSINIKLVEGEGFQGNSTGGAIAGSQPPRTIVPDLPPDVDILDEEIPDLGAEDDLQGGNQDLQDAITAISDIMGDDWARRTSEWAQGKLDGSDQLTFILAQAGAIGTSRGVDPNGPAGGMGQGNLRTSLREMLTGVGVEPPQNPGRN